jgi:hypothetical protein
MINLLPLLSLLAPLASASIQNNLAYDSPSFKAPSLALPRHEVQERHALKKRWEYYDGQVNFPYGVASGDPCTLRRFSFTIPRTNPLTPTTSIRLGHPVDPPNPLDLGSPTHMPRISSFDYQLVFRLFQPGTIQPSLDNHRCGL